MISVNTGDAVTRITIEQAEKSNALSQEMIADLRTAVIAADDGGNIVTIRGEGDYFSAGADLSEVKELTHDSAIEFAKRGQALTNAIESTSMPTIAAIDGPCLGGGLEIALACDLRVATPCSVFGEPGVRVGVFGCWGGTYRLPRIVGLGNALELSLLGDTIDATTAVEMGLISSISDDLDGIEDILERLSDAPDSSVRAIKKLVRHNHGSSREDALEQERVYFAEQFTTDHSDRIDEHLS